MQQTSLDSHGRLMVIGDVDRLGPCVQDSFGPEPVASARTYLQGIAEIGRNPARAVLVGHDPACRRPEQAIAAIKSVAGTARVVFCCDPAYENLGRRLVQFGADDYVIYPPDPRDLERVLNMPSRTTRERWLE